MNSSYGKSNNKSSSTNAFDFDLGLGSARTKPMNSHNKNQTSSSHQNTTSFWTQQPNKPAWAHQPAPSAQSSGPGSLSGPTSMVGDIFGKSWNSNVGVVNSNNPNLFDDLLSSAMAQNETGRSNVPLKNAAPASSRSVFSMGNVADSMPKSDDYMKHSGSNVGSSSGGNVTLSNKFSKSLNLGGASMRSGGIGANKDPFVSLVDFGSKPIGGMSSVGKETDESGFGNDPFGEFQNATSRTSASSFSPLDDFGSNPLGNDPFSEFQNVSSKTSASLFSPLDDFGSNPLGNDPFSEFENATSKTSASPFSPLDDFGSKPIGNDPFSEFQNVTSKTSASSSSPLDDFEFNPLGNDPFSEFQSATSKTSASSFSPLDDFGFSNSQTQSQNQPSKTNDFDALFSLPSENEGFTSQQDDWGINSENDTGGTTELEGLPPPPAGVSAQSAKNKGMDNYKQGQFADAIKWLSWAVILLEKASDDDGTMEVLTCRASCYKEVGEYKKAVADCTKVLGNDANNVSVLVQRALLYESMEKYKLGAEDLRTVMKIDPTNRVARSTIHRLTKMAG